ncbi:hypothetical protein KAI04_04575 [Candidatus Pacearchaeota archaeon]|nr:hypothetical protein [Candidatus Pacearchaeota archaeon]
MVLKEKVKLIWGSIFVFLAVGLAVYFIYLVFNWMIANATVILALLTAVLALAISLLNNVKFKKWKK